MSSAIVWVLTFVVTMLVLGLVVSLFGGIGSVELLLLVVVSAVIATVVARRRTASTPTPRH
jgi:hypothetical protein